MLIIFICLSVLVLIGVAYVLFNIIFPPILFDGCSMYPTYNDGEIVRGTRIFNTKHFKVGDIYVYHRTNEEGETYPVIKRLDEVKVTTHGTYLYFLGDNSQNSIDSRDYGYVESTKVIAKIIKPKNIKEGEINEESKCS